ncbi:MAG TPA: type II toxin-antitoxin system PemK/MazF family toxin [Verrucomicrobiae bacterium]|nr:type II toxin-antitoxin system PemK/MazF family toxin [Verrucomicrobiae bacterium]
MPSTTRYKTGANVVLIPFPFTDLSTTKQRPALVVSSDAINTTREGVIVVAITSQIPARLANDELLIPASDLKACGLPRASIVRFGKVVTLHQQLIVKAIGTMPADSLAAALARFRQLC